ncbi:MAG: hypothetical protein ABI651_02020, partial [Verrucomicrobiota bacterium]
LLSRGWEKWLGHESLATKIGAVFIPASGAGLIYFAVTLWLKIEPALDVVNLVRQRWRKIFR